MVTNATGVWTGANYGDTANYNSGKPGEINIDDRDKEVLRGLAGKVKELSLDPAQEEKRKLWYLQNSLGSTRPLVFADPENGWNEIITEQKIKCRGSLARRWETVLQKELFWGSEIKDDKPVESFFDIGYTFNEGSWGVPDVFHGGEKGGSYAWEASVKEIKDLQNIRFPQIEVDYKTTQDTFELAKEIFSDLLDVRLKGVWWWGVIRTWDLARLVGLEQMMIYMYDNPGLIHRVMEFLRDGNLARLDFLYKNKLLSLNNDGTYIGSGGLGYTTQLPKSGFDSNMVRTDDMWGFSESQETVSISPQMFEDFIFQYQVPVLERFGLNYYGCCEPLEKKWDIIKNIPNLRRVSVSSWADPKKMAEFLQDKYIYCFKPSPTGLSVPDMDEASERKKIRNILEITRGCVLNILMHDNHTLGNNPGNIINWVKIVRQEIDKMY